MTDEAGIAAHPLTVHRARRQPLAMCRRSRRSSPSTQSPMSWSGCRTSCRARSGTARGASRNSSARCAPRSATREIARAGRAFHDRGGRARADRCRSVARKAQAGDRSAGRRAHPPGLARRPAHARVSVGRPMSKRSFRTALAVVIGSLVIVVGGRRLVRAPRVRVSRRGARRRAATTSRSRSRRGMSFPAVASLLADKGVIDEADLVSPLRDVGRRHDEHQDRQVPHQGQPDADARCSTSSSPASRRSRSRSRCPRARTCSSTSS